MNLSFEKGVEYLIHVCGEKESLANIAKQKKYDGWELDSVGKEDGNSILVFKKYFIKNNDFSTSKKIDARFKRIARSLASMPGDIVQTETEPESDSNDSEPNEDLFKISAIDILGAIESLDSEYPEDEALNRIEDIVRFSGLDETIIRFIELGASAQALEVLKNIGAGVDINLAITENQFNNSLDNLSFEEISRLDESLDNSTIERMFQTNVRLRE